MVNTMFPLSRGMGIHICMSLLIVKMTRAAGAHGAQRQTGSPRRTATRGQRQAGNPRRIATRGRARGEKPTAHSDTRGRRRSPTLPISTEGDEVQGFQSQIRRVGAVHGDRGQQLLSRCLPPCRCGASAGGEGSIASGESGSPVEAAVRVQRLSRGGWAVLSRCHWGHPHQQHRLPRHPGRRPRRPRDRDRAPPLHLEAR